MNTVSIETPLPQSCEQRHGDGSPEWLRASDRAGDTDLDISLTRVGLAVTSIATGAFATDLAQAARGIGTLTFWIEFALYVIVVLFLIYGNLSYQLCRLGHLARLKQHRHATVPNRARDGCPRLPPVTILVPSYKEEPKVVRQTLLSAMLQNHTDRRVVLLIDDPQADGDAAATSALLAMRDLVSTLNERMSAAAMPFRDALTRFRAVTHFDKTILSEEAIRISELYLAAANVLNELARETPCADHTDRFFIDRILLGPANDHLGMAAIWLERAHAPQGLNATEILREYSLLASLFEVDLSRFERKSFSNLSHEPNKAMNLNSYMGLMGLSFRVIEINGEAHLVECAHSEASLTVPATKYLITLDADSLLLPEYAAVLIAKMEAPDSDRIAVAQTPYSAIPGADRVLERTAGATTDIQYLIHQGFTHHGATFWVGANAVLRWEALQDIAEDDDWQGHAIRRYIQDRTVIEDTESTIDLIDKGWVLFNYPERLAYSATPPDFGSLAIQRARWANGGLIILPKLLRYTFSEGNRLSRMREGFFRTHYLTSIAGVNLGLLLILMFPFPTAFQSWWLPLTAMPYFALYARDLWRCGYRHPADLFRVYALNLILLPINLGGVFRSLHQAWKRHKIPFHRTPKIEDRTRVAARYIAALLAITAVCLGNGIWNLAVGRGSIAIFCLLNAVVFLYGMGAFIGFREALLDLKAGIPGRSQLIERLVAIG